MKHLNNFIIEKLKISNAKNMLKSSYSQKDFLGDIIIEPIKEVTNEFDDGVDKMTYFNVIKDDVVIGVIEKNTNLYFNLIVSSSTYENIMGEKCTPSDTDYPDLPWRIEDKIKKYFTNISFIHGGGITDIYVLIEDKKEYSYDLYHMDGFQELLEYIKTTLE